MITCTTASLVLDHDYHRRFSLLFSSTSLPMSRTKLKTFIPLFTTLFRSILKRFYSHNIYLYVYIIRYDERVIAAYVINFSSFFLTGRLDEKRKRKKERLSLLVRDTVIGGTKRGTETERMLFRRQHTHLLGVGTACFDRVRSSSRNSV